MTEPLFVSPSLKVKKVRKCLEILDGLLPDEESLLGVYPSTSFSFGFLVVTEQRVVGFDTAYKNSAKAFKREVRRDDIREVRGTSGSMYSTLEIVRPEGLGEKYGNLPRDEIDHIVSCVSCLTAPDPLAAFQQKLNDDRESAEAHRQQTLLEKEETEGAPVRQKLEEERTAAEAEESLYAARQVLYDALCDVIGARQDGLTDGAALSDANALKRALAAARVNDIRAEEVAIQEGARRAVSASAWGGKRSRTFMKHVDRLHEAGHLRKAEYLGKVTAMRWWGKTDFDRSVKPMDKIWVSSRKGGVGRIDIWGDRVVTDAGDVFLVDADLRATVDTAGGITHTKQPSGAAAAAGAILPGSALIPAMVFSRTEKHDTRELFLALEHPEWAIVAQVHPKESSKMRLLAAALNHVARRHASSRPDSIEVASAPSTMVSQLEGLTKLYESGALTEDEFLKAKQRLLDS